LSSELEYMRAFVLPSLLNKVHSNHRRGVNEFAIYEIAKTHSKKQVKAKLPIEQERVALVFSADDKVAEAKYQGAAYYEAKKYLEYLLGPGFANRISYEPLSDTKWPETTKFLSDKRSASVMVDKKFIGVLGEFKGAVRKKLKLREFSAGFELDLAAIIELFGDETSYRKVSRYPGSEHDVTFETPQKVSFAEVLLGFRQALTVKNLQVVVVPKDAYQKYEDSPQRNLTFRLDITNTTKTMSTDEINMIVDGAVEKTSKKLGLKRI
jgi:phenylalanyl-tRNA synthetase beta chain